MRKRTKHIDIRLTPEEKSKIDNNAKKCGLSTSEYMRQLAHGYEPKPLPPLDYRELKERITDLYLEFNERGERQYADWLMGTLKEMIVAISPKKGGSDGDHKNMACS